ncbi:MAG: peroxiredoxin [Deltaproteobacteria bacterium]|nr:peroxiredoxin [Deltaproteobacteria bacterium]
MGREMLQPGETMPAFTVEDQAGDEVSSDSLLGGGPLVIFFYPADNTPGCTAQACGFRDQHEDFLDAGARVVGVSGDSVESHAAFVQERRLPYTLLADEGNHLRKSFGVPRGLLGLAPGRVPFVFDDAGVVRAVTNSSLNPLKHVHEALNVVRELKAASS